MNYVVYVEYHATNYYPSSYDYIKLSAHNLAEAVIESDKMFVREKCALLESWKRGESRKSMTITPRFNVIRQSWKSITWCGLHLW